MRRASAKRELHFHGFPRKRSLFVVRTRVGCLARSFSVFVCHCVIEFDSTMFSATFSHRAQCTRHHYRSRRVLLCTHTHTHKTKPYRVGTVGGRPGSWARTHAQNETLSCWCGRRSSRVGRAEVDAATNVCRHMAGPNRTD